MTNDINPDNFLLYPFSQPYRYTGMTEGKDNGFASKPVMYTMRLMADELFDFTSVQQVNVSTNSHTRVYKFTRARGTDCYVVWSESGWNTQSPEIPNGETVSIPVISDSLKLYHIITQPGQTQPVSSVIFPSSGNISLQLGFEPVIIEETKASTGMDEHPTNSGAGFSKSFLRNCPDPLPATGTKLTLRAGVRERNSGMIIFASIIFSE